MPKEINLADYGIDLAAIAMSGQKTTTVPGTKKMWEEINSSNNFVLLSNFQSGHIRINPTMTTQDEGITTSVALQVQAVIGDMMTISIVMGSTWDSVNGYGDETSIVCVATTVSLT